MNGACNVKLFLAPPPGALGRGQKVKYHLNSITKSVSKIFIPNFVCVLTNQRSKTQIISDGIYILTPGSCPRGGTLGRWGAKRGQIFVSKHGHPIYQIDGDGKQNRMQVKVLS